MFEKVDDWLKDKHVDSAKACASGIETLKEFLGDSEFTLSVYKDYSEYVKDKYAYETMKHKIYAANDYFRFIGKKPLFSTISRELEGVSALDVYYAQEIIKERSYKMKDRDLLLVTILSEEPWGIDAVNKLMPGDITNMEVLMYVSDRLKRLVNAYDKNVKMFNENMNYCNIYSILRRHKLNYNGLRGYAVGVQIHHGVDLEDIIDFFNIEDPVIVWGYL